MLFGYQELLNTSDSLGDMDPTSETAFIMVHKIFQFLHDGTSVTQKFPDNKRPKFKDNQIYDEYQSYHGGIIIMHDYITAEMAGIMSIAYNSKDGLLQNDNNSVKRAYHHRPKMMAEISNLLLLGPFSIFICSTDKKNYPIWKYLVGIQLGKELIESNIKNAPQAPQCHFFGNLRVHFLKNLGKMGFNGLTGKINWERFLDLYHTEFSVS
ncbi:hypothetical protein O181_010585 [Austropuccinia psidii MF-1]|uniref:Uncharacterized protein n=1 Tax=Austropuccinia psidii MF-1 TaxID=1389203 RepID=A0A9Q3BTI1_9BASI|nr:hypothetical protein [Austropuccinia psidii MF-1]